MISRNEAKTIWELKGGDLISPWPGGSSPVVFLRFYDQSDRRGREWKNMWTAVQGRGKYYCIATIDHRGDNRDHYVCEDQLKDLRYVVLNRDT